ncbi:MAG: IPT/TIG domain-containing protein, partial [Actinomycetota bacterium]
KAGPPSLIGFWPSTGVTYTGVFLFGKNFQMAPGTVPLYPTVKFNNGTLLAPITQTVAPDLQFVLQPAGVTQGKITVDTAIGSAITSTDYNAPVQPGVKINGIWPAEVKVLTIVFVFGQNFSTVPGVNKITVNGLAAPIVQPLDTSLVLFLVPTGATSGPVCVTVPGYTVQCSATNLTILP